MKHIPVILQHQKCKAAGTVINSQRGCSKKHWVCATAWQQKKWGPEGSTYYSCKNRTNNVISILDQYPPPLFKSPQARQNVMSWL